MASRDTESICSIQMAAGVMDGELDRSPGALQAQDETPCSVLLSVPASPSELHLHDPARPRLMKHARFHSQPSMLMRGGGEAPAMPRSGSTRERDRRFDHFRTFSGRRERQLSNLHGIVQHEPPADDIERGVAPMISQEHTDEDNDIPSADRYFAALEGPELETLRSTEVAVLPNDELWPFLLRFPINAFGMCLGVNSQAMLWKTLSSEQSMGFLGVHPTVNHVLWWISIVLTVIVSITYLLKVVFYFQAVRREFHHPIRVNFFFAPWIAYLFLVMGLPLPEREINHIVWYILVAPILCLDLKIYGQWMSSGERRLSKVANPSNHLAVVGDFVGALVGARMGLRELPIFFFAVGLAHYLVLFVTLYQRLPTNVQLPKELHPIFFFFVTVPSVASTAWARISGDFSNGPKLLYFVSMFLYASLVVRIKLFRGVQFSMAWWAYTSPLTSAALATVSYASKVDTMLTRALAIVLAGIATVAVTGVLVTTIYHALVSKDLFPNDVPIAITRRKPKFNKILAHLHSSSPAHGTI